MRYLKHFKLFESNNSEIELFEDLLQEYFDEFRIYPKGTTDQLIFNGNTVNGDYTIKRVSTTYFKVSGFPNNAKGIHIIVSLWRHDELREKIAIGLSNFIRRIQKMGYVVDASYDDSHGNNCFHISILDKKVEESVRYLNKGFEVSEDDFTTWSYEHDLDPNGFNNGEQQQIDFWSKQSNFNVVDKSDENNSYVSLNDGCLRFDIGKFKDEWFTLFIEEEDGTEEYYLFETWEDLAERINKHLDRYLNYYSDESQEDEEEFESATYVGSNNKSEKITLDQYKELTSKWSKSILSDFEMKKLENIFKVWVNRSEVNYRFRDGELYLELGGRYFGKEIVIEKYEDDWYFINIIPRDAHTFASRNSRSYESYRDFYSCDQFDGVLDFMRQINDVYTSNKDHSIFESKSENQDLCKELFDAELYDFMESHSNEPMTDSEKERITEILADTYIEVKMKGNPTEWGFEEWYFDDKVISINKYSDSYYLVEEEWSNSWNKDHKVYLCDELESIKYIDFYA